MKSTLRHLTGLMVFAFLGTGMAYATNIPGGTVTSTITIYSDSKLTGNLACTLTGAPCIQFGASGITLNLNGHTITGNAQRNACTLTTLEDAISTNGKNAVSIEGPGLIREFNDRGIVVSGNESEVEGVAVVSTCIEGIVVEGTRNLIESNSVSRASLNGGFNAAIWVQGTGQHVIRNNQVAGQGYLANFVNNFGPFSAGGAQGIFVGFDTNGDAPSKNNIIEGNATMGTPGSGIFITLYSTGNKIVGNQSLGNLIFDDIFDQNAVGGNFYFGNLCEVSRVGPSAANVCQVPNIAGHVAPFPDGN